MGFNIRKVADKVAKKQNSALGKAFGKGNKLQDKLISKDPVAKRLVKHDPVAKAAVRQQAAIQNAVLDENARVANVAKKGPKKAIKAGPKAALPFGGKPPHASKIKLPGQD